MAVDAFVRALYGSHPYSRKVRGTVETVEALKRQDLVRCYQKGFVPSGVTVVVVGDVDEELAVQTVSRAFADWSGGELGPVAVPDAERPSARSLVAVPMMNKSQADVAYGFVGIRRHDLDYTASAVMNNALGQYAIGGRLGDSIRERQGMAYYVFSSLDAGFGEGPLTIRAGVSAENVERTIASIDTELTAVLTDGFTQQEIDESKGYLIGSIPRQLETNGAIAAFLLTRGDLRPRPRLRRPPARVDPGRSRWTTRTPPRAGCSIRRARRSRSPAPGRPTRRTCRTDLWNLSERFSLTSISR